ncbi:MAG: AAA family ATPase [Chloroflexi bacterium]|nr:AAA family ATPase [Chloroflexota bacterium]
MQITRLDLDNFGPFNALRVDGFSPGLTIVHGENEAGKSALRAFMRVVLFGFPQRRTPERSQYYYEPLLPGGAGGSMHVLDSAGDPYAINRVEGVRGGPVTISGTRDGGEDLLAEITGGVDDAFYQNVFSISLSELQSFESLGRGEITDRIYSAGLGLGNISLREVTRQLDDRLSTFQRTASTRSTAGSLFDIEKELRAARDELEDRRRDLSGYDRLGEELGTLERSAADLDDQLTALRTGALRTSRLLELRAPWQARRRLHDEIQTLPAADAVPVGAVDRLATYEADVRNAESRLADGDRRDRERARHASSLPLIEAFGRRENDVRRAVSRIGYYEEALRDLPRRDAEAAEIENGVVRDLVAIGPGWTPDRLDEFNDHAGMIAGVQAAADSRADAQREAARTRADQVSTNEAVRQATDALLTATHRLQATPDPPSGSVEELEQRRDRLESLQGALAELESDRSQRVTQRPAGRDGFDRPGGLLLGILLAIAGLAGIVWAAIASEITGFVVGAGALIVGASLAVTAQRQSKQKPAGEGSGVEGRPSVEQEIVSIVAGLGLQSTPSSRMVVEMRNAAGRDIENRRESEALAESVETARATLSTANHRTDEVAAGCLEADQALRQADEGWTHLLTELGFHAHFERDGALAAVNELGLLAARRRQAFGLRERVTGMQTRNTETDRLVTSILEDAGLQSSGAEGGLAALREMERRWEDHVEAVGQRQTLSRESDDWKDEREGLLASRDAATAGIENMLRDAGCDTAERFREVATMSERRRTLDNELDTIRRATPDLFNENAPSIDEALGQAAPEDLQARLAGYDEEIERTRLERDAAVSRSGEVTAILRQMETEAEVARLHARIDELTERLREDARRWSVLTVARALLDQTREEFQERRQPSLLQTASRYFSQMTMGKYAAVRAVIGEERFEAVSENGRPVRPERLSRGAAEQLWLSIRFALVDEYRSRSPLPVILDDLLVNFDPQRARAACDAISVLAARQQVIFLTCQPSTVSMLRDAVIAGPGNDISVINLGGQGNQPVEVRYEDAPANPSPVQSYPPASDQPIEPELQPLPPRTRPLL